MYRIEVAPGEETVFRTIDELAVGIRNGVITPRARIYHHASQKWLPIGLHPHYKKALEMPGATSTPTPTRLKAQPPAQPEPRSVAHAPPEQKRAPEPRPSVEPRPGPKASAPPRIPAPVQSPVIAMQNEVLRDLPVISIPEPLPWTVPAPRPAPPPVQTQAPAPRAPAARAPTPRAPVAHPPTPRAPAAHVPAVRARMTHAPVAYAPLEPSSPAEHGSDADAGEEAAPRPTARRSRRMAGRPLLLLGAATALVIGTHLVVTAAPAPPVSPAPSGVPAAMAEDASHEDSPEPSESPRVTIAPARVPMTPGPAFAGSVPAGTGVDTDRPKAAMPAAATIGVAAPAVIAPAPSAIDLAVPDIASDSVIAPHRSSDTLGMKKILRALNGSKPAEIPAAP